MAAPSSSVVTVDPDGDLVLLLELMPIRESNESSSKPQINVPNANVFSPEAANSPGETQNVCTQTFKSKVLVSSKHMSFASPVFKAMLTGDFKEAVELREKGRIEIPLPDDDASAMITLVNIIHGRFKSVTKNPGLALFTEIAILVDKYQCHEPTELAVKVWIANHRLLPWSQSWSWYGTACWICVAWVFGIDDEFKEATEKIIRESGVGLGAILKENDLDFPIPERVINKIDKSRENAVSQLINVLKDTISRYQSQTLICPSHSSPVLDITSQRETCDATVLGSLIKSATEKGLFPLPEAPFDDSLRYCGVKGSIETLNAQTACDVVVQDESLHHDILKMIQQSIKSMDENLSGLSLADCK
ncbi:uncharacterized protein Bfra_005728 [Botrytis fragariae]|uniref:BTB domain-containing protein n=1 Tax=Botrytis fragariae TaxID=1964551 RepID=A0A8H6EHD1_9HELO|nr:uncharacterized protein Bfra_005728 [Botrytis fragariae]KAF5872369.1 hypothetical protein Bfra_005728 [Botrytis fragariae]